MSFIFIHKSAGAFHEVSAVLVRHINTLTPKQKGRDFPDDIFKGIFLNKKLDFWLKFHWSLFPIDNNPALV